MLNVTQAVFSSTSGNLLLQKNTIYITCLYEQWKLLVNIMIGKARLTGDSEENLPLPASLRDELMRDGPVFRIDPVRLKT